MLDFAGLSSGIGRAPAIQNLVHFPIAEYYEEINFLVNS